MRGASLGVPVPVMVSGYRDGAQVLASVQWHAFLQIACIVAIIKYLQMYHVGVGPQLSRLAWGAKSPAVLTNRKMGCCPSHELGSIDEFEVGIDSQSEIESSSLAPDDDFTVQLIMLAPTPFFVPVGDQRPIIVELVAWPYLVRFVYESGRASPRRG